MGNGGSLGTENLSGMIFEEAGHRLGEGLNGVQRTAAYNSPVDRRLAGPVRSFEREGRIQSAERAVPTLSSYNLTNLLSA